jgi:hypothetical protein
MLRYASVDTSHLQRNGWLEVYGNTSAYSYSKNSRFPAVPFYFITGRGRDEGARTLSIVSTGTILPKQDDDIDPTPKNVAGRVFP